MDEHKEYYKLWFEYLRRSDNYKEYYEWRRGRKDNELRPLPRKFIDGSLAPPGTSIYEMLYSTFFDVYNLNFDKWWEGYKIRIERFSGWAQKLEPIENCAVETESLEADFDQCIDSFKRSEGREPSANELKTYFIQSLNRGAKRTLLLKIDLAYGPIVIKDEFKKWVNSSEGKESFADAKSWGLLADQFRKPTGQTPIKDLQNYLEVYDMWDEKVRNRKYGDPGGWDEIIQHFEPRAQKRTADQCDKSFKRKHGKKPGVLELQEMLDEEHKRYASLDRRYKRYKEKAAKIISNVERGYFPG